MSERPGGSDTPSTPIRVVLVDDQELIRAGFRALIDSAPDLLVVGEAGDGQSGVQTVRSTPTDVVLMDIRMPGHDGLSATREICADPDLTDVRVVVLTTFELDDYVVEAVQAGASGFLGKGLSPAELLDGIRAVHSGEALLSPTATRVLMNAAAGSGTLAVDLDRDTLDRLTEREREMVALAAHGLTNDEIAERAFLSPLTVKTHLNQAMTKLHARDRAQLVVLAYRTGLVAPGDELD